jgi:hypothetical protein
MSDNQANGTTPITSFTHTVDYAAELTDVHDQEGLRQVFRVVLRVDGREVASYVRSVSIEKEKDLPEKLATSRFEGELCIANKYLSKQLNNYFQEELEKHAPVVDLYTEHSKRRRKRGRPSAWTKDTLTEAIVSALCNLPRPKDRTQEQVAELLKVSHGKQAPASGEALHELLDRLGMDWKALKNGQKVFASLNVEK